MKFKIACRPRSKNSVAQRLISSSLAIGLIFSSLSTSFASMLSEDGRYETFEGSHITIDNILEEEKVDIEIEGNTLVNYVNLEKFSSNGDKNAITINSNSIVIENPSTWSKVYYYFNLKPNTTYTIKVSAHNLTDTIISTYIRPNHDISSRDVIRTTLFDSGEKATKIKAFTTSNTGELCFSLESPATTGIATYSNIMLLEGDYSNVDIEYFKGLKSVGQQDNDSGLIELKSQNKNLFNGEWLDDTAIGINKDHHYGEHYPSIGYKSSKDYIKVNPSGFYSHNKPRAWVLEYDKNFNIIRWNDKWAKYQLTPNTHYVKFYVHNDNSDNFMFEEREIASSYVEKKESIIEILLTEPLRSVPSGVKDRIIKRNGQWMIERKCKEVVLDGSKDERWGLGNENVNIADSKTISFQRHFDNIEYKDVNSINIISDKFPSYTHAFSANITEDKEWIRHYSSTSTNVGVRILKSKLSSETIEGFEEWLSNNPLTVVYELQEPIYEPLKVSPTLNTYLDRTYISNDSIIQANMKVTIDRGINKATEAINLAKANPTIENLSKARMWTNLLKESTNKDFLHNEINNLTDIDDLETRKKTATANIDIYIKSDNALSMTLSTNSILFNDYSGVSDIEKLNALEITINSSLPYDLNAYLESEIQNSDKSTTIDSNLLQIKESSNLDYKTFNNTTDKVILEEDCPSGNYNKHNIDLKMEGSNAYKADVYKTVIKFEAQQK